MMGVDLGLSRSSSCLIASEILDGQSSWNSEGKVALLGVLRGGRIGLTFGMLMLVVEATCCQ